MSKLKIIVFIFFSLMSNAIYSQDTIQQKIDYFISQVKLDSAKNFIQRKLELADQKQNKNALNYQLVKVLFMQSAYDEALKHAFESLDEINDDGQSVKFNFIIGAIYSAIADYSKSAGYFDLVVQHSQDTALSLQTHLLLSQIHLDLGDSIKTGQSLTIANELVKASNVAPRMRDHVVMQYNFFYEKYELCKAQNLKIISDSTSFLNAKSYAYSMMGDCLVRQDSLLKGADYFEEFLQLTFETKDPEQIKVAANKLIEVYEQLDNQEKANTYHKIYNEAESDSLSFSIEKYKDLYHVEKNRELAIAKAERFKKDLLFGLMLLVITFFGMYYYLTSKKKKAILAEEKAPGKKIVISDVEVAKMETAIDKLISKQLFLKANITRKSFCAANEIKSERYLSQYINEKYKRSFSIFINDQRIKYAHQRLQEDQVFRNYKVEEIAKACGFGSKKSFERAFQAKYELTPYKFISGLTN